jgi:hypothetical protein
MKGNHPTAVLVLFLVGGALVGSIVNDVLSPVVPVLRHAAADGGLSPATLRLVVISVTFGFSIHLTIGTALGLALGLLAYKRF